VLRVDASARIEAAEAAIEVGLSREAMSNAEAASHGAPGSADDSSSSGAEAAGSVAELAGPRTIAGYHAHVYGAADLGGRDLEALHARAQRELTRARIGRLRREPVGPHPLPMFQIAFDRDRLDAVVPWLIERREGRSVLVHPLHGAHLAEHTEDALWLGERLELDVSVF
jgi:DOPA 4,5-dioxygenase